MKKLTGIFLLLAMLLAALPGQADTDTYDTILAQAEAGDAQAQYALGYRYETGDGVELDDNEAIEWYLMAADQGDIEAQYRLGLIFDKGDGIVDGSWQADIEQARFWYQKAALQGHLKAQLSLAYAWSGKGWMDEGDINVEEAAVWFAMAAVQGDALAQCVLGDMYERGVGVEKDAEKALELYRQSAKQSFVYAQTNIGLMYDKDDNNGFDGLVERKQAIHWLEQACAQGDALAGYYLGSIYVEEDNVKAMYWYKQSADLDFHEAAYCYNWLYEETYGITPIEAEIIEYISIAQQGDAEAQAHLASLYRWNGDYEEALDWYQKAIDQGNASAMRNMGLLYARGNGVAKDYAQAMAWYNKAAQQGDAKAMCYIAQLYQYGKGVAQDNAQAFEWFLKAAELGDAQAMYSLGMMYEYGDGITKEDAEATEWYWKAAQQGHGDALWKIGNMYQNGLNVERDYMQAIHWYGLAGLDNELAKPSLDGLLMVDHMQ